MGLIEFLNTVRRTPGAISMTEAVGLYNTITLHLNPQLPAGTAVDLGAHAGKSSMVAARALTSLKRNDVFCCIDLLYDLTNEAWKNTVQGSSENLPWPHAKHPNFGGIVEKRVQNSCELPVGTFGMSSLQFLTLPKVKEKADIIYAFVDTDDHETDLVMAEVEALCGLIVPGGLVFFHDFENQFIGPKTAHQAMIATGKFEDVPINWDDAIAFAKEYDLETNNDSWHIYEDVPFPTFIGCCKRRAEK